MQRLITIAIPTHNRSKLIRATLDSLARQQLPDGVKAELLIVDNNSTDDTDATIADFVSASHFTARGIFEPRQGSSFARNRAVAEAQGDPILFIDDDAVAEPEWAAQLLAALDARRLDAACGLVLPRWPAPPPRWLGPSVYIKLAVHNEALINRSASGAADSIHNYFSANVAFRRDTFTRFGAFREELGVVGGNPMSGEDTELFERITRLGGAMGFAPGARVHHLIPPERMTRRYLRRKSYAFGVGSALTGGRTHNHFDKLPRNLLRMGFAALRGDVERVVYHQLECANFFGYWRGRVLLMRRRHGSNHG